MRSVITGACALAVLFLGATFPVRADAQYGGRSASPGRPPAKGAPAEPAAPRPAEPVRPDKTVEIAVTAEGFVPSEVTVKRGQRVRLVVKRRTDDTCVREFVLDEFLVWKRLPLNEAVSDEFVTGRTGDFPFRVPTCTVSGTLHVVE